MYATLGVIKGNIMGTTSFHLQIKGMRKSQDFIVYPIQKDDDAQEIKIQSDTRIGRLNMGTGKGFMSQSHQSGAYNHHLSMDKLVEFELSPLDLQTLKMQIFTTASSKAGKSGVMFCDNSNAVNVLSL